jgi:mycothiol S-conjugate amidase
VTSLLAFHAHPDDESSKGAATVARYADAGVRCVLVCATGGEAGDILNPAMDRPEVVADLPAVRRAELEAAARIIGYAEVVELGYRDSGMPDTPDNGHGDAFVNAPFDEVLGRMVEIVRRIRPEVVLGYDDHSRYPHPDHLRVHDVSLALVDAAADGDQFPEAGAPWRIPRLFAPVFTRKRAVALHDAMIARGEESPFASRLDWFADIGENSRPLWHVDVVGYVERGRDALRAHATQVDPNGFWFQVPTEVVEDVYPCEDFEALGGFDMPFAAGDELLDLSSGSTE